MPATLALEGVSLGLAGTAQAAEPPTLTVQADRAGWDLQAHLVTFDGNVRATRAEVSLACEHLEVRYTRPERLESATAKGKVVVRQGERRIEADVASLDVSSGRLELTGAPHLDEGGQQLQGRQIVVWLDQQRVECEACTLVVPGAAVAPLPQRVTP